MVLAAVCGLDRNVTRTGTVAAARRLTLTAICRGTLAVNFTVNCEATFTTPLRGGGRREERGGRSWPVSSYRD